MFRTIGCTEHHVHSYKRLECYSQIYCITSNQILLNDNKDQ